MPYPKMIKCQSCLINGHCIDNYQDDTPPCAINNNPPLELIPYINKMFCSVDDAKKRNSTADLSAIAYQLITKIIEVSSKG